MKLVQSTGNLLDSQCDALVNPVNCVGVMGKGLALQFKQRWPKMYDLYRSRCNFGHYKPGSAHIAQYPWGGSATPYPQFGPEHPQNRCIINFATKDHWRDPSRIEWIESGLIDLVGIINTYRIASIAIPQIGCGLGGLNWRDVKPMIINALQPLDIELHLWE